MRTSLLFSPRLLLERVSARLNRRHRMRRLRGTCAHWLNEYQAESIELIEFAGKQGARVFYDIGANVGSWTVLCRALVPHSSIVAFEPLPGHCENFLVNTRKLRDVKLMPVALGSREETRPFYPASFSDAGSFLPLGAEGSRAWNIRNEAPTPLRLTTLDLQIAAENLPRPDFIKLDVQGFELEVLRGSLGALRQASWILSEVSRVPFYEGQVLFSELAGFLGTHGFEVFAWSQAVRPGPMPEQIDVLFHRPERAAPR